MRAHHPLFLLFAFAGVEAPARAEGEDAPAVSLAVDYTADVWAVTHGGSDRGIRYLDDLALSLSLDAERAIGWRGARLHAQLLYNNGTALSEPLAGDVQAISNIETGVRAVRLYEAWVDQRVGDRLSLRFGLYDLNSEFDANEAGGLFLNSSHGIGPDFSQSGENGPSIFPVTALALRVDYALGESTRVRAAVLDAVPGDPDRPARTVIRLSEEEGALFVGEIERRWRGGKATIGAWAYGEPAERLAAPGTDTARGAYLLVEQRLAGEPDDPGALTGWLRIGVAEPDVHAIAAYLGGGLVLSGPIAGRRSDALGLAFARVRFSRAYRALEDAERGELNLELTYRAQLSEAFALQPDVQIVFDPSGVRGRPTAVAIGLRSALSF
ncbi:carbohydrate porin [Sphingosinicella terrae]|uniref:carbohydrate porin n=1 Tax=Sphingosinicella terrae TaxID=2172047 RepID=UPI0013B3F6EF|nr:carbohydrate porin [Sphingosinicella terrae]